MNTDKLTEEAKCNHTHIISNMGYLAAHDDAEKRIAKGQKQKQCPICKLWLFEDEYGSGYPSDPVIVNIPKKIYLHPNPDSLEVETGEIDFQDIDHEFTTWSDEVEKSSDVLIEYTLSSSIPKETDAVEFVIWTFKAGWILVREKIDGEDRFLYKKDIGTEIIKKGLNNVYNLFVEAQKSKPQK